MHLYKIQNKIDGKVYVGITGNYKRRWKEHRYGLNKEKHRNKFLQAAWKKYGKENFKFELIDSFDSLEDLMNAEIIYIKKNDLLNSKKGYNLSPGGLGIFEHTEESKRLIAKSNERPVICKSLESGLIKTYEKTSDVKKDGFDPKTIARACSGKILTHKKHVWMYLEEHKVKKGKLDLKYKNYQNTKARPVRYKKVFGMNIKTLEILQYDAVYHVVKHGFSHQAVYKCCVSPKTNKTHKKFVWSFSKNNLIDKLKEAKKGRRTRKQIYKFDLLGRFIEKVDRASCNKNELRGMAQVCFGTRETYSGHKYSYSKVLENKKYTKKAFLKKDKDGSIVKKYNNIKDLLADNSYVKDTTNIYRCCHGDRKLAYGYRWSFGDIVWR